jgi:hypothetical protein
MRLMALAGWSSPSTRIWPDAAWGFLGMGVGTLQWDGPARSFMEAENYSSPRRSRGTTWSMKPRGLMIWVGP